jgi:hypothetical protein
MVELEIFSTLITFSDISMFRLTEKILSSPILGLGYLNWEFSWEYSKVLWHWGLIWKWGSLQLWLVDRGCLLLLAYRHLISYLVYPEGLFAPSPDLDVLQDFWDQRLFFMYAISFKMTNNQTVRKKMTCRSLLRQLRNCGQGQRFI